jgi:hypothetical protein
MNELLGTPLALGVLALAALLAVSPLWLAWRVERHLYHISVALWQIRDALRDQPADKPITGVPHITTSMFGR